MSRHEAYDAKAWTSSLPCPDCGQMTVIGYLLVNEQGSHMHTKYACTFWPSSKSLTVAEKPCGWQGWSVPGWDAEEKDLQTE